MPTIAVGLSAGEAGLLPQTEAIDGAPVVLVRRRVTAYGSVQGVFFRDTVRRKAVQRGVAGWVRNRTDGSVEAVFEGDPDAVSSVVGLMREGPRGAVVSRVEVIDEEPEGLSGFAIR